MDFFASLSSCISDYLDSRAQQRRADSAAQQVQAPATRFAQAWNTAGGIEPLRATVQDPVRGPLMFYPVCDAAMSDDGTHLYVTLTVPPDAPISTDDIARVHAEAVRQAVRMFFQVAVRQIGVDVRQTTTVFAYEPVRPVLDAAGAALMGYTKRGRLIYIPLLGEVTAVTGDDCDAALYWIGAAYSAVERRTTDPASAVSSIDAVARQALHGAVPAPQLLALGDAICPENRRPVSVDVKKLALARRGVIETSLADVMPDRWAVRPTQTIRRDGDVCVLEKAGRHLRFTPAWAY